MTPRPDSLGRRLAGAIGLGLLATSAGCTAGALLLVVFGAASEGAHLLRLAPAFVLYGQFFGPLFAWPTTLLVLPALWLFFPLSPRRTKAAVLLGAGPLTGAATLAGRVLDEAGANPVSWSLVAAGAVGGLAASTVFLLFLPRAPSAA